MRTGLRIALCAVVIPGVVLGASWAAPAEEPSIGWAVQDSGPAPPISVASRIVDPDGLSLSATVLSQVPTSSWTYGCSATSAGMMFGYYDRTGYSNMYAGPANGGVAPLTDLGGQCSIIATRNGFDGRTTSGHVDDYWISYESTGPDPFEGNWTEHAWGGCTADYMGTNQWKWDVDGDGNRERNSDGATTYWYYDSGARLYDYVPPAAYGEPQTALCHGLRLFAESRGYSVPTNYTQQTDNLYSDGFSFDDYAGEIDAGCPVMIHVEGHSLVGVGYDPADDTVYLHDTWGDYLAEMPWGGSYSGMGMQAVSVIHVVPEPATLSLLALGLGCLLARRRG